jgi:hypothetical protein
MRNRREHAPFLGHTFLSRPADELVDGGWGIAEINYMMRSIFQFG